jgi:hypothetical protein
MKKAAPPKANADGRLKSKSSRRQYRADGEERCRSCNQMIPPGSLFVIGLTHEPHHTVCKRLGVTPVVLPPARPSTSPFKDVQFMPHPCGGCGDLVQPGEREVHVNGQPWHAECRKRERVV